jgi:hypothetical protein
MNAKRFAGKLISGFSLIQEEFRGRFGQVTTAKTWLQ